MSTSSFHFVSFLFDEVEIVNKTGNDVKINIVSSLFKDSPQRMNIPNGCTQIVLLEESFRTNIPCLSVLRVWKLGSNGFYETELKLGRKYVLFASEQTNNTHCCFNVK